jgi:hypothetical protein
MVMIMLKPSCTSCHCHSSQYVRTLPQATSAYEHTMAQPRPPCHQQLCAHPKEAFPAGLHVPHLPRTMHTLNSDQLGGGPCHNMSSSVHLCRHLCLVLHTRPPGLNQWSFPPLPVFICAATSRA